MGNSKVFSYSIDSEEEADSYLNSLFNNEKYRTTDEVLIRAEKYIADSNIKKYFIAKAKEKLF